MKKIIVSFLFLIVSLITNAQSVKLEWAKVIGDTSYDYANSMAVDANGNVYTSGAFKGTVDFNPDSSGKFNLTSTGSSDMFISKLDRNGNFVWAKNIGGVSAQTVGHALAVDASGNVYCAGRFNGTVDFDPGPGSYNLTPVSAKDDIFIIKLNASGDFIWAKKTGGMDRDFISSIAIDVDGNICATGHFHGLVDFDPGGGQFNLKTTSNTSDIFILKLDSSGNFIWARSMEGQLQGEGTSIVVDKWMNVYTTGFFNGKVDFDPDPVVKYYFNNSGQRFDVFISKLDSSGNFVWAKQIVGNSVAIGSSLALDGSNNVLITGQYYSDTVDFDPGAGTFNLIRGRNSDRYILKLNTSGNFIWAKNPGGYCGTGGARRISVDVSGNIYTTGALIDTTDFDPGLGIFQLASDSLEDIYIKVRFLRKFCMGQNNRWKI